MKNLVKKHMIGLFALVLTVATMSFKMVEKSNVKSTDPFWSYNLDTIAGEEFATNYSPASENEPCPGGSVRCLIQAPDVGGYPDLDAAVERGHKAAS